MAHNCLPHRHYQCIADVLEQTIAMLPREERSGRLRMHIETAIETAMELAYTPHSRPSLVYSSRRITGRGLDRDT